MCHLLRLTVIFFYYIYILQMWICILETFDISENIFLFSKIQCNCAYLQSFTHQWPLTLSVSHTQWCPGTCTFVSHSSHNKPSPGFWVCEPVVSLLRSAIPRKTGTLRQTVGRRFPTICSKCMEPSVIKNRKAYVPPSPRSSLQLAWLFSGASLLPVWLAGPGVGP